MVSAAVMFVLAAVAALPALPPASAAPDSARTSIDDARLEDALLEGELEPGELESERRSTDALAARAALRFTPGAFALRLGGAHGVLAGDVLLAKEKGEPRAIDDAFARVTVRLGPRGDVAAGWLLPRLGGELVIGRRRTFSERPFAPRAGDAAGMLRLDALPPSSPASAMAGVRGVWARYAWDAWSAVLLASDTPRDARPSGDGEAWWPVSSALHRSAVEAARRGRLRERLVALAVATPQAWLVVARTWTPPRRAVPVLPGTVAEAASGVVTGGAAVEVGTQLARAASLAWAFDAHGRARTRASWTLVERAGAGETTAEIAFASEASGFTPLLARAENLPRAHLAACVKTRVGRGRASRVLALEGYAIERGPLQSGRAGFATLVRALPGVDFGLARDLEPERTLVSARWTGPSMPAGRAGFALAASAEWRFDARGLARESARLEARARGPRGLWAELETRLASGRSGFAAIDLDAPGGGWTRRARGAIRTRITLGRTARRIEPRASVAWIGDGVSRSIEGWCALEVALGPP